MRWALLLSGGAARGALQVGVVEHLWETLGPPSAVAGVSVGALHALLLAEGRANELRTLWGDVAANGSGWFQRVNADAWNGAHTMRPLMRRMEAMEAGRRCKIPAWVGVVDVASWEYESVPLLPLKPEGRRLVTLASATQPGVHEHIRWAGRWHMDGGTRHVMPMLPDWESYDEIHAVFCRPLTGRPSEPDQREVAQAWEQVAQFIAMSVDRIVLEDVGRLKAQDAYIYAPLRWKDTGRSFDASERMIRRRLRTGERMAKAPAWDPR